MLEPIPDSTFVSTICNLIRRGKLGKLLFKYQNSNSPKEKIELLLEIKKLQSKGVSHYKTSSIEHALEDL